MVFSTVFLVFGFFWGFVTVCIVFVFFCGFRWIFPDFLPEGSLFGILFFGMSLVFKSTIFSGFWLAWETVFHLGALWFFSTGFSLFVFLGVCIVLLFGISVVFSCFLLICLGFSQVFWRSMFFMIVFSLRFGVFCSERVFVGAFPKPGG